MQFYSMWNKIKKKKHNVSLKLLNIKITELKMHDAYLQIYKNWES